MKCPYCDFENPEGSARCACCLHEFTPGAAPAPGQAPAPASGQAAAEPGGVAHCPKCGFANQPGATQCECCLATLEPSGAAQPAAAGPPTASAEPAALSLPAGSAAKANKAGQAIGVIIALVILFGVRVLWRTVWRESTRRVTAPLSAKGPASPQPAPQLPAAPASPPPASTAATSKQAPGQKAAPEPEEDPAAEVQFRVGLGWERRGDLQKARESYGQVILRFPTSRFAAQARMRLENLPTTSASAATNTAADASDAGGSAGPRRAPREEAFERWKERYEDERTAGKRHSVITEDDLAGSSGIAKNDRRGRGTLPPSIAAARVAPEPAPENPPPAARPNERLSLVSASLSGNSATLQLLYSVGSNHARPVYASARVRFPDRPQNYFGYGSEPLPAGSGTTSLTVQLGPQGAAGSRPSSVRLMLFEAQGAVFFSQDVPFPQ